MRHKRVSEVQRRINAILAQQYAILNEAASATDCVSNKQVTDVTEVVRCGRSCQSVQRADRSWDEV